MTNIQWYLMSRADAGEAETGNAQDLRCGVTVDAESAVDGGERTDLICFV